MQYIQDSLEKINKLANNQLRDYFLGNRKQFDLPLAPKGTDFQKLVWNEVAKIPYGETATYSDIAQRIHKPKAVRAVASAIARNPLHIFIPCHRVVAKNGIGGYAAGIEIKKFLLNLEKYNSIEQTK
ncbi:MAG: methylated-DNA--[protein]-cysteine S-methyltransferase [Muribaculaceae bacterium]|nr:methylated-DNA--[protein]-cysteine S-methyltransferase [Muribaculaceae bacterium]